MASYFKILNVTYNCEKECPCRPENKIITSGLSTAKDQDFSLLPAPKKVRFTVVPVTESASFADQPRSGWF